MNNPQRQDQLGTSVQSYGNRFMAGINQVPSLPPPINVPSLPPVGAPAPPPTAVAKAQPMGSLPAFSFTPVRRVRHQALLPVPATSRQPQLRAIANQYFTVPTADPASMGPAI